MDLDGFAQRAAGVVPTERDVVQVAADLEAGASLVLAGPLGCGKSLLIRRVREQLRERGHDPVVLHPAAQLADTPFAVLDATEDERVGALRAETLPAGTIVLVDDAQNLDAASAAALTRAVYAHRAAALFALSIPRVDGEQEATPATSALIDLWLQGFAQRIDLAVLDTRMSRELVERLSEGTLDRVSVDALVWQGNGSRTLLQELTVAAMAATRADTDPLAAIRDAPVHGRLSDALDAHVRELDAGTLQTLVLIDRAPGIAYADAARARPAAEMDALLTSGYLDQDDSGQRRLHANPALARAAGRRLGNTRAEAVVDVAIARMLAAQGQWWSTPLALTLAARWLQSEQDRASTAPALQERVLVDAARDMNDRGACSLAAAYASLGLENLSSVALEVELAYARAVVGTRSEPFALASDGIQESHRERAMHLCSQLRARGLFDTATAFARVLDLDPERIDSATNDERVLLEADTALVEMRWADARESATLALHSPNPTTRLRAHLCRALVAAFSGEDDLARRHVARLLALLAEDNHPPLHTAERLMSLCVAMVVAQLIGDEDDRVHRSVAAQRRRAVREGGDHLLALAGLASAFSLAISGDGEGAVRELDAARRRLPHIPHDEGITLVKICIAYPLALLGQTETAQGVLDRILGAREDVPPMLAQSCASTECVVLAAQEQWDRAIAAARRATIMSEHARTPALRARDLFRLLALGVGGDRELDELAQLAAATDIPIAHRLANAARELPPHLDADGVLAALRLTLTWRSPDEPRAPRLPRAAAPAEGALFHTLTRREREIALLADAGLSNREIAERLFLSVRTVESHIYQARAKVHAATRRELGIAVAAWATRQNSVGVADGLRRLPPA